MMINKDKKMKKVTDNLITIFNVLEKNNIQYSEFINNIPIDKLKFTLEYDKSIKTIFIIHNNLRIPISQLTELSKIPLNKLLVEYIIMYCEYTLSYTIFSFDDKCKIIKTYFTSLFKSIESVENINNTFIDDELVKRFKATCFICSRIISTDILSFSFFKQIMYLIKQNKTVQFCFEKDGNQTDAYYLKINGNYIDVSEKIVPLYCVIPDNLMVDNYIVKSKEYKINDSEKDNLQIIIKY